MVYKVDKVDKKFFLLTEKGSIYKGLGTTKGLVVVPNPKVDKMDKNIHIYPLYLSKKVDII